MEENKVTYQKIAVRCIFTRPVAPNFLVINLPEKEWKTFLWGDAATRMEIVHPYLPKTHPEIREISWIPLSNMSNQDKTIMILNILNQ